MFLIKFHKILVKVILKLDSYKIYKQKVLTVNNKFFVQR